MLIKINKSKKTIFNNPSAVYCVKIINKLEYKNLVKLNTSVQCCCYKTGTEIIVDTFVSFMSSDIELSKDLQGNN